MQQTKIELLSHTAAKSTYPRATTVS